MASKRYNETKEKLPTEATDVATAVAALKTHAHTKFDETVELHVHLGVDYSKSDQTVRATVQLPGGAPKQKNVAVFAETDAQEAAKAAGAAIVGGEELIEKVTKEGTLAADVVIATPAFMPKIARIARILGPQGLMPNPKTGTVTPDPAAAVKDLLGGKLSLRMDQLGNIHEAVGKVSWEADKIISNIQAVIEAITAARPAGAKGQLIRTCSIKTTMSPAVRVNV